MEHGRIKWLLGSNVIICRTTATKFTGWVTEMFTFQLNVYTVAFSLQQLIVIIEWLRLNIQGFLMKMDRESNTLDLHGLEEPFSSCAVVSVFCSGGK